MTASAPQKMEAFTFGEPSAVLDRRDILDYVECINNGKWYEPPVSFNGLAKACAPPFITARRFTLSATFCLTFIPHPLLSRQDFSRLRLIIWCLATRF
jgi:capsid portal protein